MKVAKKKSVEEVVREVQIWLSDRRLKEKDKNRPWTDQERTALAYARNGDHTAAYMMITCSTPFIEVDKVTGKQVYFDKDGKVPATATFACEVVDCCFCKGRPYDDSQEPTADWKNTGFAGYEDFLESLEPMAPGDGISDFQATVEWLKFIKMPPQANMDTDTDTDERKRRKNAVVPWKLWKRTFVTIDLGATALLFDKQGLFLFHVNKDTKQTFLRSRDGTQK